MEAAPTADVDPATAAAMQRDMRRVDTRLARRGRPEPGTPVDHVHVGTRERRRRRRAERAARAAGARRLLCFCLGAALNRLGSTSQARQPSGGTWTRPLRQTRADSATAPAACFYTKAGPATTAVSCSVRAFGMRMQS